MFDEIKNIKSGRKELREFGITIGIVLILLGSFALWRGKNAAPYFISFGAIFIAFGLFLPGVLRPLQKAWMATAIIIGFFMSRIILAVLFYFVITPFGVIIKMSGKDILDERIDRTRNSYWADRQEVNKSRESYENQF